MTDEKNADKPMPMPDAEIIAGWDEAIRKAFPERLVVEGYNVHDWRATRAKAVGIIDLLMEMVEVSLEPNGRKFLSERDILDLQYTGLAQLGSSFNEIEKCAIDPLKDGKPATAAHLYTQLWRLVGAAFIIGSRGTVSESAIKMTKARATEDANSTKAAKAAKVEAIISDVLGSTIDKPYSVKNSDRDKINENLKNSGLGPMTIKAIGDVRNRMKKLRDVIP